MTENEQIEKLIKIAKAGNTVRILGLGNSMRPLLHGGRDYIYMQSFDVSDLKKGDVVLYKTDSIYKIHRIMKIVPEGYVIAGDGNQFLEPPISSDCIYLKAIGFQRNGKYIDVRMLSYKIYSSLWRILFHFRPIVRRTKWMLNIILRKGTDR